MDIKMLILTIIFMIVFVAPFFIISAIKDKKEAKQKEEENKQ